MTQIPKNSQKCSIRMALMVLLVFSCPHFTYAAEQLEQIGKIVAVRGKVSATSQVGNTRNLTISSPIFISDQIQTNKTGRAQILFNDRGIISLGNNTDLRVDQFLWKEESKDIGMKAQVKEGVFRIIGGLITKKKPDSVQIGTPSATIGIRGSMYSASVKGNKLDVLFEGGKGISLQNAKGIITITKPGFGSQVKGYNTPLGQAKEFSLQQINNTNMGLQVKTPPPPTNQGKSPVKNINRASNPAAKDSTAKLSGKAQGNTSASQSASPETGESLSPEKAKETLIQSIKDGMSTETAMESVLRSLKNPNRETFDQLVNEAIDQGLNAQQANNIIKRLKESGACK